jgi:hypothetical protein
MHFPRPLSIGIVCSFVLLTIGCSKAPTDAVSIKTDNGTVEAGTGKLPADWPTDIPTYPESKLGAAASFNPDTGKPGSMVSMETTDTPQQVADYYKNSLKENGWKVEASTDGGKYVAVMVTKDARTATVHATTADDGKLTTVIIATGEK